ncbi:MAG: hypothetical protein LBQ45_00970 [Mycoplasmataceae bacterium]|jgi:hypothetical protein|nr:hypothetical protein [Mycoplasmataceae bacterium]
MQTRIERWKSYRDEIKNKATIIEHIESKNEKIATYKKQIESISPKIINNISVDEYLTPLLSFDKNENTDAETILNILSQINYSELEKVENKLNMINQKNDDMQNNVLFSGIKMNKLWLEKNYEDYPTNVKIENEIEQIKKDISHAEYKKISVAENIGAGDNDQEIIERVKEYNITTEPSKFNHRKFYFSTAIICLTLLAVLFLLVFYDEIIRL